MKINSFCLTTGAIALFSSLNSISQSNGMIENKGQFHNQFNQPRPDILFGGKSQHFDFHIRKNGISYQLYKEEAFHEEMDPKTQTPLHVTDQLMVQRIDQTWVGSAPDFTIKKGKSSTDYYNYYLPVCPNGLNQVRSYEMVTLENIWEKVDVKYYYYNNQLKYDYIVHPGGQVNNIQIEVKGAELSLDVNGLLHIKTPLGTIVEEKPIVIQNGKKLNACWIIKKNVVSYSIPNYNHRMDLIIDPVVRDWGTYYGTNYEDILYCSANDAEGNIYAAGKTADATGSTLLSTTGAFQTAMSVSGGVEGIYVKFSKAGLREYATYYGGAGSDQIFGCAVDASGNVYVCGITSSSTGMSTVGAHDETHTVSTMDGFLSKFDATGARLWGTYYGGGGNDQMNFCDIDNSTGDIYVVGNTNSTNFISSVGGFQTAIGGGDDAFLVGFNSSGARIWGTYYGAAGSDKAYGVSAEDGTIYIAGYTTSATSTNIASAGSHQASFGGATDGFLAKFGSAGTRNWGTYYGGVDDDYGLSCQADLSGVYLVGSAETSTGTFIATTGSHQATYGGGARDAYVCKFTTAGVRTWATYYGGSGDDTFPASALADDGSIYVAGSTASPTSTALATELQTTYGGGTYDGLLAKFNSSGIRQWGSYYGGSLQDIGTGCAASGNNEVYLVGLTSSTGGTSIATTGSFDATYNNLIDGFVTRITDCPFASSSVTSTDVSCYGYNDGEVVVTMTPSSPYYTFNWSNGETTQGIIGLSPGTYTCDIIDACGNNYSITANITEPAPINVATSLSGTTITALNLFASFQWVSCPSYTTIPFATGQNFTPTSNGDYAVIVTEGSCSDTSACVNVTGVSIEDPMELSHSVTLYPNPARDYVILESPYAITNPTLIDGSGQMVSTPFLNNKNTITVITSGLPKGIYTLQINVLDNTIIKRFVLD